jgi:hypothetical protein
VTLDCVTGFSVQNERLRKPSALFRGLCVGRIEPFDDIGRDRFRCHPSCGNSDERSCLQLVTRVCWSWRAWGYAWDQGPVHGHIANRVWGGANGSYNRLLSPSVTTVGGWRQH